MQNAHRMPWWVLVALVLAWCSIMVLCKGAGQPAQAKEPNAPWQIAESICNCDGDVLYWRKSDWLAFVDAYPVPIDCQLLCVNAGVRIGYRMDCGDGLQWWWRCSTVIVAEGFDFDEPCEAPDEADADVCCWCTDEDCADVPCLQ